MKSKNELKLVKISQKDLSILRELDINSRQSFSKIGKKIKLPKNIVSYRVKKLIEKDILQLFITPFNYTKMGYFQSRVFLKFTHFTEKFEKKVVDFLSQIKHITWIGRMEGNYDLEIIFQTKSLKQLEQSYSKIVETFDKDIIQKEFCIDALKYYLRHNCLYDKKIDNVNIAQPYDTIEMPNSTDLKIIKKLSRNSRMPVVNLAKELKITQQTVIRRINYLIKEKWIKGFCVRINLPLLGYYLYNVLFKLKNIDSYSEKKIITYLSSRKDIGYIGKMIGPWDLEVEFQVKNEYDLHNILSEINSKFSKHIKEYIYLFTVKKYPTYTAEY